MLFSKANVQKQTLDGHRLTSDLQVVFIPSRSFVDETFHRGLGPQVQPD